MEAGGRRRPLSYTGQAARRDSPDPHGGGSSVADPTLGGLGLGGSRPFAVISLPRRPLCSPHGSLPEYIYMTSVCRKAAPQANPTP
eukprot:1184447-Prorocentrum_minimum.AAC.3